MTMTAENGRYLRNWAKFSTSKVLTASLESLIKNACSERLLSLVESCGVCIFRDNIYIIKGLQRNGSKSSSFFLFIHFHNCTYTFWFLFWVTGVDFGALSLITRCAESPQQTALVCLISKACAQS